MKTAAHMRMARGALGWSQSELAETAGLSVPTIKRMELNGFDNIKPASVDAVRAAFEKHGVRFMNQGCVCPPKTAAT